MPRQRVTDQGPPRKYWTQVPNMLDDSDLDPYARTLLLHYLRIAGRHDTCAETVRETADHCRMSPSSVTRARATLVSEGWIEVEEAGTHGRGADQCIHLLDRWVENMARYAENGHSELGNVPHRNNSVGGHPDGETPADDMDCSQDETNCSPQERIVPHRNVPYHHGNNSISDLFLRPEEEKNREHLVPPAPKGAPPAQNGTVQASPKPPGNARVAEVIDAFRERLADSSVREPVFTGRDYAAIKMSTAPPELIVEVYEAVAVCEYGDQFMRKRLSVHEAIEWINGYVEWKAEQTWRNSNGSA